MRRLATFLVILAAATGCGGDGDEAERDTVPRPPPATVEQSPPPGGGRELARNPGGPRVETVATGLEAPWEIAFLPDGRALVTERPGRVRLLERDLSLREEPIAENGDILAIGEGGLLGVAVDPRFDENGFVYLYATTETGNEVSRMRWRGIVWWTARSSSTAFRPPPFTTAAGSISGRTTTSTSPRAMRVRTTCPRIRGR